MCHPFLASSTERKRLCHSLRLQRPHFESSKESNQGSDTSRKTHTCHCSCLPLLGQNQLTDHFRDHIEREQFPSSHKTLCSCERRHRKSDLLASNLRRSLLNTIPSAQDQKTYLQKPYITPNC